MWRSLRRGAVADRPTLRARWASGRARTWGTRRRRVARRQADGERRGHGLGRSRSRQRAASARGRGVERGSHVIRVGHKRLFFPFRMPTAVARDAIRSALLLLQLARVDAQQEARRMCAGNLDAAHDFTSALCAQHIAGTDLVANADDVAGEDHATCCTCPMGWYVDQSVGSLARCRPCPPGTEPANRTGCAACTGNFYSAAGQCALCVGDVTADRKDCVPCGINEVADPPELGCRCENGFYNATDGPLVCISRERSYESINFTKHAAGDDSAQGGHHCRKCPKDCVDCLYDGYGGRPLLQPGYGTFPPGPDWFNKAPRVVFECPGADKLACKEEAVASAGNFTGSTNISAYVPCEDGYEQPLCSVCSRGFRISGTGCLLCEGFSYMATAVVGFLAFIFFLMAIESSAKLRHNPVVRKLRLHNAGRKVRALIILFQEMFNDVKVFLTLYQVLSSMGQTLEISCESLQSAVVCVCVCVCAFANHH